MATAAGKLKERVRFEPRVLDANGDPTGPFTVEGALTVWARVQPLKGSEPVIQQRLVGVQPVAITIRLSRASSGITSAWRMVWREGIYNIKTAIPSVDRAFIDLMAEADQTNGG